MNPLTLNYCSYYSSEHLKIILYVVISMTPRVLKMNILETTFPNYFSACPNQCSKSEQQSCKGILNCRTRCTLPNQGFAIFFPVAIPTFLTLPKIQGASERNLCNKGFPKAIQALQGKVFLVLEIQLKCTTSATLSNRQL